MAIAQGLRTEYFGCDQPTDRVQSAECFARSVLPVGYQRAPLIHGGVGLIDGTPDPANNGTEQISKDKQGFKIRIVGLISLTVKTTLSGRRIGLDNWKESAETIETTMDIAIFIGKMKE